ncbi:MAG: tol-pal system protein YbgF [Bradyrhizobium sp.]|uniref:tol-pal system protein YbgF n=1 Tax=Bradyrhizobium sp. TaxID=376 RepID=UPI00271C2749|nr:tol-pal system protein YbgF [Bradyrhizobium sp.]MDO8398116.1 tol-pal system protein YbgF [Bradyrhizobium sp.]
MSSRIHGITRAVAIAAMLALSSPAWAQQSDDADAELRIQQLENRLRQLTGQNEELQYRNRQLEERLRALQGGAQAAPGGPPAAAPPNIAAQPAPAPLRQPQIQPGPQIAAPAPIVQEPPQGGPPASGRRRGDAFDPSQNPNAPGAPQALGGGQLPIPAEGPVGAPGGRGAGEPLDLANTGGPRNPAGVLPPPSRAPGAGAGLTTLPPSATPKDEFDLGIGYMQRKDYALAEETMRNFAQKYPSDPLMADSQYWLGESFFQRQLYRDAAESFLAVTTKFDKSGKAPDALLRLGQSLAALKEKEAACAALGEVTRKYPRASGSVKTAVDREQKRNKC